MDDGTVKDGDFPEGEEYDRLHLVTYRYPVRECLLCDEKEPMVLVDFSDGLKLYHESHLTKVRDEPSEDAIEVDIQHRDYCSMHEGNGCNCLGDRCNG